MSGCSGAVVRIGFPGLRKGARAAYKSVVEGGREGVDEMGDAAGSGSGDDMEKGVTLMITMKELGHV